ncbi:unnamed protein product [Miscanthus lutarioriparius]|uniref:Uncharacterized protein n=1 Tax=Miscanthus lutarioriparius TaxID=422564 RepID=A0A811MPN0_9POAL|nr:unnamed protein product [Miscanthus lutarioriparius]
MAAAAALLLSPWLVSLPPQPSLAPGFTKRLTPYPSYPLLGRRGARLRAVGDGPGSGLPDQATVYNGAYGPWTVEDSDVREVLLYRSGLVTAAASFVAAASAAFLPEGNPAAGAGAADLLYAAGAGARGWACRCSSSTSTSPRSSDSSRRCGRPGCSAPSGPTSSPPARWTRASCSTCWSTPPRCGSSAPRLPRSLASSSRKFVIHCSVIQFVDYADSNASTGLCYGKLEAGILTFVIPGLLLGHLSGLMDNSTKTTLLGVWMLLFMVFAARKFQQPIKDDIGDKSVFMFNALPEEEKNALIQKLERQKAQQQFE